MSGRWWLVVGALVAGTAVACGALGAHFFEGYAAKLYSNDLIRERRIDNWDTAAQYQMYHGLALLALGVAAMLRPSRLWNCAGTLFVIGVLLFSGSLYAIALSGVPVLKDVPPWFLAIIATPAGGICMMIAWALFALAAWRSSAEPKA